MAIDITKEQLITFAGLAKSLPRRRGDRPVHLATIHRWRSRGLKGIRLEGVRVGGAWHTSREAFRRFTERLTALVTSEEVSPPRGADHQSHIEADTSLRDGGW